jgi:glucose/arabinose dehydrogenase
LDNPTGTDVPPLQPTPPDPDPVDPTIPTPALDLNVPPGLPLLGLPRTLEFVVGQWTTETAFPSLNFDDPVSFVQAPKSNMVLVSEREGRIYSFEKDEAATAKQLVLDLSDANQGESDSGLLGLAFHPEFGDSTSSNRGYVYLHYAFSESPIVGVRPTRNPSLRSRLSRFTFDESTGLFDRSSELILIDQRDDNLNHQGGAMFFHPGDGFLYLTVGDEGDCALNNCQRTDKDLYSGVLRLDVDMQGGSISHPIPKQPETGTTANYFIPNDNPFVGRAGVLEEFYAIGLRSPHRMTYDAADNIAWIGDVGEGTREELDVLKRGGNYQWPAFEGFNPVPVAQQRAPLPLPEALGSWTDPLMDFGRDEAGAIIGGYVYRGSRLPELRGRYIFGDYVTGRIWALSYELRGTDVVPIDLELLISTQFNTASNGITSFGVDDEGELYFLTLGPTAQIQRLVSSETFASAPRLLSEVGTAPPSGQETTSYDVHGYDVQSALWSDGAVKRRWIAVPQGESLDFTPDGPWGFPEGTVFIKNFSMALDQRRPTELTPLETRFLVAGDGGSYYGITYKWNDQADAELVLERKTRDLMITDLDGSVRQQRYEFPGPNDCLACHNEHSGYVLGVRTEQLNGERLGPSGAVENQLVTWSNAGMLSQILDASDVDAFPHLVSLSDATAPVEERVRSYWASNCSMCHGVDTEIRATWDARYGTPLLEQGVVFGALSSSTATSGSQVVTPGDLLRSVMFQRTSTADRRRGIMPPLGRRRVDSDFVQLLEDWILSLPVDGLADQLEGIGVNP